MNLKGRSFLTLKDYTKEEILYLVEFSKQLKQEKKDGIFKKRLINKNIALIFEKPSTRTRCAFTVAANDEGAHPEYLGKNDIQLGHKESVEDTARVLGRMFDGIEFRGFSQKNVEKLAAFSGVPVWNGLTDEDHPTQILADFLTIEEQFGRLDNLNLVYIGDGRNNMAYALMIGCSKIGINITICTPNGLLPDEEIVKQCVIYARENNSKVEVTSSPEASVKNADVIYADVWCSMGEEDKAEERIKLLMPYQVNKKLMDNAKPDTIFLHCLPAVKNNEVTEEVFDKFSTIIFDQAENRMHTIKAIMVATLT